MAFLPGQKIRSLSVDFFENDSYLDSAIDDAAYNLRLGDEVFLSTDGSPRLLSDNDPFVVIKPGDFALLKTYETIKLPLDKIGFITLRNTLKMHGLMNVSGFHVDPGFRGRLMFSVVNVGPNDITVRYQEKLFMLFIAELETATTIKVEHRHQGQDKFSLEDMIAIRGRSATLVHIEKRIGELESSVKVYGALVAGVLIALFALVVRLLSR
jgi:dCTP deaminase